MSLPTLPPVLCHAGDSDCYTLNQHKEQCILDIHASVAKYGQQCRDAALEEAAVFIESGSFLHDQSPAKLFADQLAPKIRSLK